VPNRDGKELFAIGQSPRAEVVRYNSDTREFDLYLSGISAEGLAFTRDQQWVTYVSYPDGTLWRSKVDGGERLQLTFPPLHVLLPRWSPDGKQIAFNAVGPGLPWNIYMVPSGGGAPERLFPSDQSQVDATWSPNGKTLAFGTFGILNRPVYTIDLGSKQVSAIPGSEGLYSPRWSPDGKYIAAITTEHPNKLMVFDLIARKWTQAYGFEMGYPSWSHDRSTSTLKLGEILLSPFKKAFSVFS
jgi:Tol biopolymer transport system component